MSYFMSPQTHLDLLPSGQGERGALRTGVGTTTSPENLLPGSGEVEVLLSTLGWALESSLFKEKPFPKCLPIATLLLTLHSTNTAPALRVGGWGCGCR